jgi:hypothetical protein
MARSPGPALPRRDAPVGSPARRRRGTSGPLGRPWRSGHRPSPSRVPGRDPCPCGSSGRAAPSPPPRPRSPASAATGTRRRSRAGSARAGSATGLPSGPSTASPRPSSGAGSARVLHADRPDRTGRRRAPTRRRRDQRSCPWPTCSAHRVPPLLARPGRIVRENSATGPQPRTHRPREPTDRGAAIPRTGGWRENDAW